MTNTKYGRWKVLGTSLIGRRPALLVKCDCGKLKTVRRDIIISGQSRSCGCLQREKAKSLFTTHGMYKSREYQAWHAMIGRCYYPKQVGYERYGGRGIKVCEPWKRFVNFFSDLGTCPYGFELDRINVNGNYEPLNCRWVSQIDSRNNTSKSKPITIDGITLYRSQWAIKSGTKRKTIDSRIKRGWNPKRAVFGQEAASLVVKPEDVI